MDSVMDLVHSQVMAEVDWLTKGGAMAPKKKEAPKVTTGGTIDGGHGVGPGNWTFPKETRDEVIEDLTRDILLRMIEFKSGRGHAGDVGQAKAIAEAYADAFGY